MIHISIDKNSIETIKKIWGQWFFRVDKINEFISILDKDETFREMIFPEIEQYQKWKLEFKNNKKVLRNNEWRLKIYEFFFADLSNDKVVVEKYKKSIYSETKKFLLKNYENYRVSSCLSKIINELKIEVCPYCNRNFLEKYSAKNSLGQKKIYFKGDLDHHYSKNEIPALALSFYNLVPSCKVCNHEKSESDKRTFYPFYDYEDNEYRFFIELYNDKDKYDITYDELIDDIEHKRFDSTVWQGISDNFNIKLRGVGKTELNDCMKNSNEIFKLEKKYNNSKKYVKEIIRKKYIYPEIHKEMLLKNFGEIFKNESSILETFYSYIGSGEKIYSRPLSKLTKDILDQIGMLDD